MAGIWTQISDSGITPDMDEQFARKISISNQVAAITFSSSALYGFIFYFLGYTFPAMTLAPTALALGFTILFNRSRQYDFARTWLVIILNFAVLLYACFFGRTSGMHLVLLSNVCLPWLIFFPRDQWAIATGTALSIACYYYFSVFYDGQLLIDVPADILEAIGLSLAGITFFLLVFYTRFHVIRNQKAEGELHTANTSLLETSHQLEQAARTDKALVNFSDLTRKYNNSVQELAEATLRELLAAFECSYGAVLVYDKQQDLLELVAELGSDSSNQRQWKIKPGETLAGEAFKSSRVIRINETGLNYTHTIKSATGSLYAKDIIIMPVEFNGVTIGVVELASLGRVSDADLSLLQKIGENIAAAIISIKLNDETERSLQQANELREKTSIKVQKHYEGAQRSMHLMLERHKKKEQQLLDEISRLKEQIEKNN